MKPTRFMRIPFFVSGYKVTLDNMEALAKWCEGHVIGRGTDAPFIRVPVSRPTNKKQTEAYVDTWVVVSNHRGERSFKVYTQAGLDNQFFVLPEEPLDVGIVEELEDKTSVIDSGHALPSQRHGVGAAAHLRSVP